MTPIPSSPPAPTAQALASHAFHAEVLHAWLAPRMSDMNGPLQVHRLQGGQSNPTWLLKTAERDLVLRAKPGAKADLLPSAHAIEREFAVIKALQDTEVPVPRVVVLCEDESVIGAAFYVMEFVQGRIFRDAGLPGMTPGQCAAVHDEANRVIAALHCADWRRLGLATFGRHEGYFERLIGRWTRQYRATVTEPIEAMDCLIDCLPAHIPAGADEAQHTTLTHGDFRIENLVFHPTESRVLAVLDWELSTLGHPLSDLAYHCMAWHLPPGVLQGFSGRDLAALGIPSERAYIERYCQRTGRTDIDEVLAHWPFYLAFNCFRLAAILQGIARRVLDGTAASPVAVETSRMARPVAELGWSLLQKHATTLSASPP